MMLRYCKGRNAKCSEQPAAAAKGRADRLGDMAEINPIKRAGGRAGNRVKPTKARLNRTLACS